MSATWPCCGPADGLVGDMVRCKFGGRAARPPNWEPDTSSRRSKRAFQWDYQGRLGVIPTGGGGLVVHEFDYRQENAIVYQKNGVTIRSWPAIHALDGPVSYALEWNGLKFVFGGDTVPNTWYARYAKNADLAIHECFPTPLQLMRKQRLSAQSALNVATSVHTVPAAFGMVMAEIKPRMAVAYHFFNDFDIRFPMYEGIRRTYQGPLTMATDLLVWNITKQDVRVRQVVINPDAWPAKPLTAPISLTPNCERRSARSWTRAGSM